MTMGRGYKATLLQDFETAFNTDNGTPGGRLLPVNSITVKPTRALNAAATLTGRRDPADPFVGNTAVAGDVVVPVDCDAFGWWLKGLFGTPTTTGTEAPYTHVFKTGDTLPSMVLQTAFGTSTETYGKHNGCKVGSASFQFGGDQELTATFHIEAAKSTYGTTDYNDAATAVDMKRFSNFQASLKEGSSTLAIATDISLSIDNGLDTGVYCIGGNGYRQEIPEGTMAVSGSMTVLFEDTTLLTKAQNNTETSLELTLTIDASNKLVLLLPEVKFAFSGPEVSGPAGIKLSMDFQAYYNNDASTSSVVATLTNAVTSYAA